MSDTPSTSIITASAKNLIAPSLTFSNYMTPPMPVMGDSRLLVAFLAGRGEAVNPELGYQIWPPSLLVLFEAENARFHELRAVTPGYFSIDQPTDQPMGKGLSPAEKSTTDYLQNELRLFQCCDEVLAAIIKKQPYQRDVERFDELCRASADELLLPYCRRLRLSKVE